MNRVVKFFYRTHFKTVCVSILVFAASALALNLIFPGEVIGNGVMRSGRFSGMYAGFPAMCITFQTIWAIQCSGVNLNVALSMGARRRDYLIVCHLFLILETLFSMVMIHLLYMIDLKFTILGSFSEYMYTPEKFWLFGLFALSCQFTGLGCMAIGAGRRVIGGVLMAVFTMGMIMSVTFFAVVDSFGNWGILPGAITAGIIIFGIIGEIGYLRYMKKATVI